MRRGSASRHGVDLPTVSHGGAWAGYRSQILRFPQQHFSVIVLCNREDAESWTLAISVAEIYLKDKLGPAGKDEEAEEAEVPRLRSARMAAERPVALCRRLFRRRSQCPLRHRRARRDAGASNPVPKVICAEASKTRRICRRRWFLQPAVCRGRRRHGRIIYWSPGLHGLPFKKLRSQRVMRSNSAAALRSGRHFSSAHCLRRRSRRTTLIVNARIIDGTGSPARKGAVRFDGDRIVEVGDLEPADGEHVVDAGGLTLTPGFIDTHSHHDRGLFDRARRHGEREPGCHDHRRRPGRLDDLAGRGAVRAHAARCRWPSTWPPMSATAPFAVRSWESDFKRPATAAEIDKMRLLVDEGMEAGALGLSTGLEYDPGIYSDDRRTDRACRRRPDDTAAATSATSAARTAGSGRRSTRSSGSAARRRSRCRSRT